MKELLFLITLVLGVAIGFAGCGDDDDDVTDSAVEMTADAGGEVEAAADAGAEAGSESEETAGGAGGEAVEEEAEAGAGGEAVEETDGAAGAAGPAPQGTAHRCRRRAADIGRQRWSRRRRRRPNSFGRGFKWV